MLECIYLHALLQYFMKKKFILMFSYVSGSYLDFSALAAALVKMCLGLARLVEGKSTTGGGESSSRRLTLAGLEGVSVDDLLIPSVPRLLEDPVATSDTLPCLFLPDLPGETEDFVPFVALRPAMFAWTIIQAFAFDHVTH